MSNTLDTLNSYTHDSTKMSNKCNVALEQYCSYIYIKILIWKKLAMTAISKIILHAVQSSNDLHLRLR